MALQTTLARNKSAHSGATVNARKLEEDTDNFKHDAVDRSLSQALMKARMDKKMTQKQLATTINEKPQIVAEYESGKAIPNGQVISKLERALGVKLRVAPRRRRRRSSNLCISPTFPLHTIHVRVLSSSSRVRSLMSPPTSRCWIGSVNMSNTAC
ncbi:hypothetical protein PINS_up024011 [Pythium insidiosum]|nr:hypothetical protein PINS_up024011 [Pythium insidiosum]